VLMHHLFGLLILLVGGVECSTNPNDAAVLNDFRKGLENPDLLGWPSKGNDPCGPPSWPHVFCSKGRVTQIQVKGLGLKGTLPLNLNQLEMLQNVGFQKNSFNGRLPTFGGLSNLQYAYLDFNDLDTIPADFFQGLDSIRVLTLDGNPLNQSSGWTIPDELRQSTQLTNFSCSSCNIVGQIPGFFGTLSSLSMLRLSSNSLTGEIPSSFSSSLLQILSLNDQKGDGLSGSISVIGTMVGLTRLWLHGNQFTGPIPDSIGNLTSLRELKLNRNHLLGLIPTGLASLNLQVLDLSNNLLMGSIPEFRADTVVLDSNSFCVSDPGKQCAPAVNVLLDFLRDVNYPEKLASEWTGNDPCTGPWWGITCRNSQVSVINLQKLQLNGSLSSSLGELSSLVEIHLEGNNLQGVVPDSLTHLRFLVLLNISGNDFVPPLPKFGDGVKVVTDGNPNLVAADGGVKNGSSSSPSSSPPPRHDDDSDSSPARAPQPDISEQPRRSPSSGDGTISDSPGEVSTPQKLRKSWMIKIVAATSGCVLFAFLAILCAVICFRKKKKRTKRSSSVVSVDPKDSPDHKKFKLAAMQNAEKQQHHSGISSWSSEGLDEAKSAVVFPFQLLQRVTDNFAKENELGRGGFGTVYRGKLDDGKGIAVKRMEEAAGSISSKAVAEFQAEIASLSKLRHRNLVSLLGYSVEGSEKLLVYEYMPKGSLNQHLFRWKSSNFEPLSLTRRLTIALDVARGVEYLHSLANQSFIHRDLKSANILLDDEFRAKISDFGLVKLAPHDEEKDIATRVAGTFGYLAPEYAVMGKVTTKVDIYSFGVILMELLTGLAALDSHLPEENKHLVSWFLARKSSKSDLIASVDPALEAREEIYPSIYIMAELAGLCSSRDPNHRPEMGYVVNVLAQLVDTWRPPYQQGSSSSSDHLRWSDDSTSFSLTPLPALLRAWQGEEGDRRSSDFSGGGGSSPEK
ncbi:hypothetical protein M569_06603, partial [Genlisea aurea]